MEWKTLLMVIIIPAIPVLIASIVTEFEDPDHNPATPPPRWVRVLRILQYILTTRVPEDRKGLFGTKWSLPGLWPSKKEEVIGNVIGSGPKADG